MQAIITKYIPATNFKPSRIKASCERGSVTISYDSGLNDEDAHLKAADTLVARFVAEDEAKYGSDRKSNPWGRKRVMGGLPNGQRCHVFTT